MDVTTEQREAERKGPDPAAAEQSSDPDWCRSIATRIAEGDCSAESQLIARLSPGLLMLVNARCHDAELTADVCQETFIILLKRLRGRTLQDPSRIAAFAAQTARQLLYDWRRRNELRRTTVDSSAVEAAEIEAPPDMSLDQHAAAALVGRLLAELAHDRDREILRRFYLLDQDKPEICRELGLSTGSFDQIVFRARARLRAMLNARGVASRDFLCTFGLWIPRSWLN